MKNEFQNSGSSKKVLLRDGLISDKFWHIFSCFKIDKQEVKGKKQLKK